MREFTIKIGEDRDVWDDFVKKSQQGTVFLYSDLLNSLMTEYTLVTYYDGDTIVAGAAVFFEKEGVLKSQTNKFMLYQGVLLKDNVLLEINKRITYEHTVLTCFLEELSQRYHCLSFCNSWKLSDLRAFQWFNYHAPEKGTFDINLYYTGIVDLQKYNNFADYVSRTRQLRRREMKKAKGLLIEEITDVDLLIELHNKTYGRQGIELSEQVSNYRRSIIKAALQNGYGKMAKITTEAGCVASVIFFLYDALTAYYLFGANEPEERKSGAATKLMLHFISEAMKDNIRYIDFCGVNSPNRGDYKISFNAELYPYFITTYRKPAK